ncbi:protein of unknown function [Xenorhabdus bovienii]|uniref:Uncharacterized protein n=2 Tax=Xenorhabdus bovienii TaxID=40576 RepID=A0A0B6XEH0_XENBV|nr:hypothetical protein XBKB1_400040 [Xenorhabdus bovienii str. kraussei Becker Underwood]CDM91945.1 protein of unknown function [Xenorhabdus bovienii]
MSGNLPPLLKYSRYGGYTLNDYTPPSIEMGASSNYLRL